MAGGKETPRQKLIGMMYLVLTALLALNVSTTVIDKFVFLDDSLVRANKESEERNTQILESIVKTVDDTGNRPEDAKVVEVAQEIRAEAARVITELSELKATLVDLTGGYEEGHQPEYKGDARHLKGKTDYDKVGHYMMPEEEGGEGHGARLKEVLNGYAEFVREKLIALGAEEGELTYFRPIALDADEDPIYQKDPNQQGKSFAALAFDSSPTPAGLATISEFQSRVLNYETGALDFLSGKVGAGDLKFDVIVPMVKPESKYVAAGTKYSAKMFIAASSSGVTPTMTYNDNEIPVDASGQGLVEFTANASKFDENGLARQTYKAAITITQPGGRDTTFTQDIEYFVVKPTIQIQSQSVQALYLRCGNKLDVQVPQLGVAYNPSFSASNAQTYTGSAKGQVTIVPTSVKEVELKVSSNGNFIGSRNFGVRRIPAPEIKAYTDQGEVNMKTGIPAKTPRLYLNAIPDESFQQFLPDDAKFRVAEAQITLVSGGIGRRTITVGQTANLGQLTAQARKGDQLVIEIKKVQRQNFRKDVENFGNFNRFINISLN
ncbi:type IX secretion system motor protein PorM/GldM [Marinoscillum furvescens]|uniref:Gliding motility-associated protein GldM n=1 Tax=Marinoscillum furvescens DSM 4134 TaxID=1122208 RepID=A0A3D9L5F9_MARFU|nr:gliding motility protein GldM [Marinoscillum furvescens]REE00496.1 gliding motility-associated protein GldM [Marinoscillum furvescens DSM 4134]